jgi:hypothetical protein
MGEDWAREIRVQRTGNGAAMRRSRTKRENVSTLRDSHAAGAGSRDLVQHGTRQRSPNPSQPGCIILPGRVSIGAARLTERVWERRKMLREKVIPGGFGRKKRRVGNVANKDLEFVRTLGEN